MSLARFIRDNMETLLADWEQFAATQVSDTRHVDRAALRDFAHGMLSALADDLDEAAHETTGLRPATSPHLKRPGRIHAMQRFREQFTERQLVAEFRALRATVMERWRRHITTFDESVCNELIRFNCAVDDLVMTSIASFNEALSAVRQRRQQALLQRNERLLKLDRQKDLFLASLGHELRNPLAGLDLGIRALKEGIGDRTRMEELIEQEVRRLTVLTNDLLDASRISRNKIRLNVEELDMAEVVRSAVDLLRLDLNSKRHRLTLDMDGPIPLVGDYIRLRQIVENLLTNAVRYTSAEGTIRVSLRARQEEITLLVADNGQGIPSEDFESIFRPFTQRDPDQGGLGLGLPIARSLTELHGGDLTVTSSGNGQGATFVVRLPRRAASGNGNPEAALTGERLPADLRVVVVDGEPEFAENLALFLRVRGCSASSAGSGTELLERFDELAPHAVIVDLSLPEFSGYQTAQALSERDHAEQTLLIAITSLTDEATTTRVDAAGFHERLLKPLDLERLQQLLRERADRGL